MAATRTKEVIDSIHERWRAVSREQADLLSELKDIALAVPSAKQPAKEGEKQMVAAVRTAGDPAVIGKLCDTLLEASEKMAAAVREVDLQLGALR